MKSTLFNKFSSSIILGLCILSITTTNAQTIPVTGTSDPEYQHVTQFIIDHMNANGVTASTLQIKKKNGAVVLDQGFGWLDAAQTQQTQPNTLMRIASVSKPFTHLAINQLIDTGALSLTAKAFCLSGETPSGSGCLIATTPAGGDGVPDPQAQNITLEHLLAHRAGWASSSFPGPIAVANALGVASPPTYQQMVNYQLDLPLDYTPGSTWSYSNISYIILGYIVELYSGTSYINYVQQNIALPLGVAITEIELGNELLTGRNLREPRYISSHGNPVPNIFNPSGSQVQEPDGGFMIGTGVGAGGLISTTSAIMSYMQSYWLHKGSTPRDPLNTGEWYFPGSFDGTRSVAQQNSPLPGFTTQADWVVLMNSRKNSSSLRDNLRSVIRNTLQKDVTITNIEGTTTFDLPMGLYVPQNATNLNFAFQDTGTISCTGMSTWNSGANYTSGQTIRHLGKKYTANVSNSNQNPKYNSNSGQEWTLNGVCYADTEVYVKRGAKPTTTNYDCRSIVSGATHNCNISTASQGFYYVTLSAVSHDYAGVSVTPTYTVSTGGCSGIPAWNSNTAYVGGNIVQHNGVRYEAAYWSQGADPATNSGPWEAWINLGSC